MTIEQLFKRLNKNEPTLLIRLDKESHLEPGQHKYTHNNIQNELIELKAKQVLAKKLESIRSSKFFGIMANETLIYQIKNYYLCVFDGSKI